MQFDPTNFTSSRKLVILTGATGAIGRAIARKIASRSEFALLMLVRNKAKAEQLAKELVNDTGNEEIYFHITDLGNKVHIQYLSGSYAGPLHVLINNASIAPPERLETEEGVELQWAVNVLGYFRLMRALTPHLRRAAPSRIVNVASYFAGGLYMQDPEFKTRPYDNNSAYRQSKQAERMLSRAFSERLSEEGISVNACHPGDVNSRLSNDLGYGGHESPGEGADTPAWLATESAGQHNTGKYFERRQASTCHYSSDKSAVDQLYRLCLSYDT
jgi:NAD(P)-dependent dehydrogenase (short-subunit alcohol dehydrogenase family)